MLNLFRSVVCREPGLAQAFSAPKFKLDLLFSIHQIRTMKRKAESPEPAARKAVKGNDYCSVQPKRDSLGNQIWPAPEDQIIAARAFLREWYGFSPY